MLLQLLMHSLLYTFHVILYTCFTSQLCHNSTWHLWQLFTISTINLILQLFSNKWPIIHKALFSTNRHNEFTNLTYNSFNQCSGSWLGVCNRCDFEKKIIPLYVKHMLCSKITNTFSKFCFKHVPSRSSQIFKSISQVSTHLYVNNIFDRINLLYYYLIFKLLLSSVFF